MVLVLLGSLSISAAAAEMTPILPQEAKLLPPDAPPGARMGTSVAVEGGVLVAGAYTDKAPATNSGSAYVFERDPESVEPWRFVQKLTVPGGESFAEFGIASAIDQGRIVVGARGIQKVYVYERSGPETAPWEIVAELFDSSGGNFGNALDLDGDVLVVGDLSDNSLTGEAFVYHRDDTGWSLEQRLLASDSEAGDAFGTSVGVSGRTIAVGANAAEMGGVTYLFEWQETQLEWVEVRTVFPEGGFFINTFGESVALDGDWLAVGAKDAPVNGMSQAGA